MLWYVIGETHRLFVKMGKTMQQKSQEDSMPSQVASAFAVFPKAVQRKLLQVRKLIYKTAAGNSEIGPLIETLKWGQPSYLPKKPRVGTTVRLGYSDKTPHEVQMFVHCQTTLVDTYRTILGNESGDVLSFEGNRAINIKLKPALPSAPLSMCIEAALTYHLHKEHLHKER